RRLSGSASRSRRNRKNNCCCSTKKAAALAAFLLFSQILSRIGCHGEVHRLRVADGGIVRSSKLQLHRVLTGTQSGDQDGVIVTVDEVPGTAINRDLDMAVIRLFFGRHLGHAAMALV